jgi:voltage-gated potassium channel Kch
VVAVSILTILAFAVVYFLLGSVGISDGNAIQTGGSFFSNLYFSTVTFTTLGYGDIQPATSVAQTLASV